MTALGQRQTDASELAATGFDPDFFMKELKKKREEYCPSGVEKCECLNAPGMFSFAYFLEL